MKRSSVVYLTNVDKNGFPSTRAMRLIKLNQIAIQQMSVLQDMESRKLLR